MSLGKYACIDCDSSDAMELYQDDDGTYNATCFAACRVEDGKGFKSHNRLADSYLKDELGITKVSYKKTDGRSAVKPKVIKRVKKEAEPISVNEIKRIIDNTSVDAKNFRGIRKDTLERYRVRTAFCEETGDVSEVYYPITKGKDKKGKVRLVGYHKRIVIPEKDFRAVGLNSKSCELFGQHLCKGKGKLVICGGQHDVLAAYQMFEDYRKAREKKNSNIAPVDFVSGTVGETSLAAQLREQYDFVDSYDEIIIDTDDDAAGQRALEAVLEVLPVQKVKVMSYAAKDANKALDDGLEDDYIRAIYNARRPLVSGISDASMILDAIKESAVEERIPLPDFMSGVNKALGGGYSQRGFQIIAAQTSVGKTLVSNSLTHHFIKENRKVGLISLEASAGQVGEQLSSIHLGIKLGEVEDVDEKLAIIEKREEELRELFYDEEGDSNLYILDDRSLLDTIDSTFKNIEKLIRVCSCEIIIIDPCSDLTDTMSLEEQNEFMGRIKKLIASNKVCIIGIAHMRKGDDKDPHAVGEFSIYGSSTTIKSAHTIILLSRDKLADSELEKNSTRVLLSKNRNTGKTGRMNDLIYCPTTGRLSEKSDSTVRF